MNALRFLGALLLGLGFVSYGSEIGTDQELVLGAQ